VYGVLILTESETTSVEISVAATISKFLSQLVSSLQRGASDGIAVHFESLTVAACLEKCAAAADAGIDRIGQNCQPHQSCNTYYHADVAAAFRWEKTPRP
jgi:hypothetical protein